MGQTQFIIGMVVVFIATLFLFSIFDNLGKIADRCAAGERLAICEKLSGFTLSVVVIILIIAGFIVVISAVIYIMLSA